MHFCDHNYTLQYDSFTLQYRYHFFFSSTDLLWSEFDGCCPLKINFLSVARGLPRSCRLTWGLNGCMVKKACIISLVSADHHDIFNKTVLYYNITFSVHTLLWSLIIWLLRKRLIRKVCKSYQKSYQYQKNNKASNWEKFKKLRKTVQKSMQRAINDYFMTLLNDSQPNNQSNAIVKLIHQKIKDSGHMSNLLEEMVVE